VQRQACAPDLAQQSGGVYMLAGTCEDCGSSGLLFWVELNEREGWIQKAGQLPAPAGARVN